MKYPRIYLVLDNCFAIKRWVEPKDWMNLVREIGFNYVQASTDNEIDPLFSTPGYMDDWFSEVRRCSDEMGVKLVNFYTGYQTYRTAGLAHFDPRIVENLKKNWIFNMVKRIGEYGADGVGFSFFAIPDKIMQDPELNKQMTDHLIDELCDIATYAAENNGVKVSVEQMYVPYQPPFTIESSVEYLQRVYSKSGHPIYITLDTGHMVGQHRFLRPSAADIEKSFSLAEPDVWLGGDSVYETWRKYKASGNFAEGVKEVVAEMDRYPYMFAEVQDTDPYPWFDRLAKYSPIVHMQQTDGTKSAHAPFTPETNKTGIITGEKLLASIMKSYESDEELQPPVEDIYLSFEVFASNTDKTPGIVKGLKQTLEYWRQFVPEDGLRLDELLRR